MVPSDWPSRRSSSRWRARTGSGTAILHGLLPASSTMTLSAAFIGYAAQLTKGHTNTPFAITLGHVALIPLAAVLRAQKAAADRADAGRRTELGRLPDPAGGRAHVAHSAARLARDAASILSPRRARAASSWRRSVIRPLRKRYRFLVSSSIASTAAWPALIASALRSPSGRKRLHPGVPRGRAAETPPAPPTKSISDAHFSSTAQRQALPITGSLSRY